MIDMIEKDIAEKIQMKWFTSSYLLLCCAMTRTKIICIIRDILQGRPLPFHFLPCKEKEKEKPIFLKKM